MCNLKPKNLINQCGGYCLPRLQCNYFYVMCSKCYPNTDSMDICLNCDLGQIVVDNMFDYLYDRGAKCEYECDMSKSVKFEVEYFLYSQQIITKICVHDGIYSLLCLYEYLINNSS